jgi:hypothetical protein
MICMRVYIALRYSLHVAGYARTRLATPGRRPEPDRTAASYGCNAYEVWGDAGTLMPS